MLPPLLDNLLNGAQNYVKWLLESLSSSSPAAAPGAGGHASNHQQSQPQPSGSLFRRRLRVALLAWLAVFVMMRVVRRLFLGANGGVSATQAVVSNGTSAGNVKQRPTIQFHAFSEFLDMVERGLISNVLIGDDDVLEFIPKAVEGGTGSTAAAAAEEGGKQVIHLTRRVPSHLWNLVTKFHERNVAFEQVHHPPPTRRNSAVQTVFLALLPVAYIGLMGYLMYRFLGNNELGGAGGGNQVGDEASATKKHKESFADVQGCDEARNAIKELCDVLKNPDRYARLGARLPRGVLIVGPPGTGKTMLARALAREAGVAFIYCAGSEFVEVFAGRGAARVRSLFQRATKSAPCIIFVDEIDALGGTRHTAGGMLGGGGGGEEREQTLNQLLSCMDGFNSDERVIVMAATNRYELLDKALTRPGRFDRVIRMELPNAKGRAAILKVHAPSELAEDVDLNEVARACEGMSGAELNAICNEAALIAVRKDKAKVEQADFMEAIRTFGHGRGRSFAVPSRGAGAKHSETNGAKRAVEALRRALEQDELE